MEHRRRLGCIHSAAPRGILPLRVEIQGEWQRRLQQPDAGAPSGTPPVIVGTIAQLAAGVNSQALYNRGVTSDITLPQIANVSMVYRFNPSGR
jgi:hypothetical protein